MLALWLTLTTGVCSEIPCCIASHFGETIHVTFIAIQMTACYNVQDLDVGNLEKDWKQFYIFSFFVYIYFTLK